MEFDIEQGDLLRLAQGAERVASGRASHPVLGGIRIQVAGTRLTAAATDLERYLVLSSDTGSMTSDDGVAVMGAKMFASVVKAMPSGKVQVATKGSEVLVRAGRTHFSLATMPVEDFPTMPDLGDTQTVLRMKGATLAFAIKQVAFAASTDEVRPVLTGVLWSHDGESVRLVATDSYRLALREVATEPTEARDVIVPAGFLRELGRFLTDADVTLRFGSMQASAEVDGVLLITRLIEGEFPKYRQLVPEGYPNTLTVDREAFMGAAARVSLVAGTNTPVKVHLGEEVRLDAVEAGVGEADEVLEGANYDGQPMVCAFNPRFLGEALGAMVGEQVVLEVSSPTKPGVLRELEGDYRHIIMPVRLSR